MSAATTNNGTAKHMHTFPDSFTTVPAGVQILPYKDYREHGIRLECQDEIVETDGLGIPTISIPGTHSTNYPKSNVKRSAPGQQPRAQGSVPGAEAAVGGRMEWYEVWATTDRARGQYAFDT